MLKKIDHMNIVVSNLEAAVDFFLDLGFTFDNRHILQGEWIYRVTGLSGVRAECALLTIPSAQTKLELLQYLAPEGGRDPQMSLPNQIGFRHMALEVEDVERAVATLKAKGRAFFGDVETSGRLKKFCYFLGPDGIVLELAEYF